MNYLSDNLIDKVFFVKNSYLNEYERKKIVDDLLTLQKKLEPMGILKETSPEKLLNVDNTTLVLVHIWQNELFAMKHFKECSRNYIYKKRGVINIKIKP